MYHVPVLYHESLDAMNIAPDSVCVDVTFGGGGHSRGIMERLGPKGKLIAFDQDTDAQRNIPENEPRLTFIPHNFQHLKRYLRLEGIKQVDCILADLGVSSHQFDEAERGFSYRFDAALDMRMDTTQGKSAADILATYRADQLLQIFGEYGEVRNSKTLAQAIVDARSKRNFKTIQDLLDFLKPLVRGEERKYLSQVFQALRMEVNDEVGTLKEMLKQAEEVLKPGGRLVVLTYHSIEDRLVKNFVKKGNFEGTDDPYDLYGKSKATMKFINNKPGEATPEEIKRNSRARSAKLRIAEKI